MINIDFHPMPETLLLHSVVYDAANAITGICPTEIIFCTSGTLGLEK